MEMKKLFSTLVAAAAALTLCLSASAEESNLIKNGDFEGSDLSQLNGFQLGMPENNPIIVDGAGRDGSKALQMGGDKNGDSWPAWINMRVGNLSLEKGKTYKFSGYVKGEENLILDVQAYHPANQQKHIMETYYGLCITSAETGLNVTTEWQPFEIVFSMASEDAALDAKLVTSNEWACSPSIPCRRRALPSL